MSKNRYEIYDTRFLLPVMIINAFITTEIEERNWHDNIEIMFAAEGSGEVILDSGCVPIKENEFCIVNAFQLHSAKSSKELTFCNILISNDFCLNNGLKINYYHFETILHIL